MNEEERSQVKLEFSGELLEKINAIKKHYGVKSNSELIRILVNEKARELKLMED